MKIKESIYKALDALTLGKGVRKQINGFKLRLPLRYHSYFPVDYENENFAFLKQYCKHGAVLIDIGAHIGLFSVCASQITGNSGKIYAFEPAPDTLQLLKKTIALNKKQPIIEPIGEAIAEKDGSTFFYVSDSEADNSNSLVEYRKDRNLHKVEVKITSVDNFLRKKNISKVDFIKIDAEGYEYNVLKGANETFGKLRPYVILALHPAGIVSNGDSLKKIYDFLFEKGYDIFWGNHIISSEEFCKKDNLFDVHLIPKPLMN